MGNYYINLVTGTIQQQSNPLLARAMILGGFAGPFNTIADAKAAYNAAKGHVAAGITGGAAGATGVTKTPLDIFKGLDLGGILLRVGEVLLGIVLVGVGVAKLTGATNLIATAVKAKI